MLLHIHNQSELDIEWNIDKEDVTIYKHEIYS